MSFTWQHNADSYMTVFFGLLLPCYSCSTQDAFAMSFKMLIEKTDKYRLMQLLKILANYIIPS